MADQDYGPILSSLLVGPCALEFTKIKTTCHSWSDLPANELVQRHKISSCGSTASSTSVSSPAASGTAATSPPAFQSKPSTANAYSPSSPNSSSHPHRNLTLNMSLVVSSPQHVKRSLSTCGMVGSGGGGTGSSASCSSGNGSNVFHFGFDSSSRSVPSQAREYVESLHQNQWDNLLYGKNNVHVLPKDSHDSVPGYLSLHQSAVGVASCCLKWTPNRLMNGMTIEDKSASWQQAVNIDLSNIQFIHCHQDGDNCTVVLVSIDGTQHQPLQFPPGGHLLQFLSCIESSLLPHGMLDPPLWSEKSRKLEESSNEPENGGPPVEDKPDPEPKSSMAKRFLPSLSRKKKEASPKATELPEPKPGAPISALEPIDTVFKIVYQGGYHPDSMTHQSSNGSGLKPDSLSGGNQIRSNVSPVAKSRTADWFANLFSPSKSRHGSSSTETSRYDRLLLWLWN